MIMVFEQVNDKQTDSIRRLNKKIMEDDRVGISIVSIWSMFPLLASLNYDDGTKLGLFRYPLAMAWQFARRDEWCLLNLRA